MGNEDPLSQLADIHLPEPIGFWPPAPGWWVVGLIVLGLMIWAAIKVFSRLRQERRYRFARRELDACLRQYRQRSADASMNAESQARQDYINDVNSVLRRVALKHFNRGDVAGLSDRRWVDFIEHHGDASLMDDSLREALAQGRFAPKCDIDPLRLHEMARRWIKSLYSTKIGDRESTSNLAAGEHA